MSDFTDEVNIMRVILAFLHWQLYIMLSAARLQLL